MIPVFVENEKYNNLVTDFLLEFWVVMIFNWLAIEKLKECMSMLVDKYSPNEVFYLLNIKY